MSKTWRLCLNAFVFLVCLLPAALVLAAPGDPDPTFGAGGKVSPMAIYPHGAELQADGKIVVAGSVSDFQNGSFTVARYNSNGSLDPTFGVAGRVDSFICSVQIVCPTTPFANAVLIQPDGKILVGGGFFSYVYNDDPPNFTFLLARFLTNGAPDLSFGNGGRVATTLDEETYGITDIALQPDGKIVAVGRAQHGIVIRYESNGSLDRGFGKDGRAETSAAEEGDFATSLVIQPNGRIIVGGFSFRGGNNGLEHSAVTAYRTDGSRDDTFGSNGRIDDLTAPASRIADMTVQPDGSIITAGWMYDGTPQKFSVSRYSPDGKLDRSWGGTGQVSTRIGTRTDYATTVALEPDGRVVVAGRSRSGPDDTESSFAVVKYDQDGSLDQDFGSGGKVVTPFITGANYAVDDGDLLIQPDGKILLTGYIAIRAGMFRYLDDQHVSVNGRVVNGSGTGVRNASVVITDGNGYSRTVLTSTFGYFSFDDIPAGRDFTINVNSRRYRFDPQTVTLNGDIADLSFVGRE